MTEVCREVPLGLLQFHGDEDPAYCDSFGRPWMKAIRVADTTDIGAEIERYRGASAVLLDAYKPDTRQCGRGHRDGATIRR